MGTQGNHSGAGLHDPYWYESLVGLGYVVRLLDPESGVLSVTFQDPGVEGIDDVVVRHASGTNEYLQIKHSRVGRPLTINDVLREGGSGSLLAGLAAGWKNSRRRNADVCVVLYSNRAGAPGMDGVTLPGLFEWLKNIPEHEDLSSLTPPEKFQKAWERFRDQLAFLEDDEQRSFVSSVEIRLDQPDSEELERKITEVLCRIFGIDEQRAKPLLDALKSKLSEWTTSRRASAEITAEEVYAALQLPRDEQVGRHEIPPPHPLFRSRGGLLDELRRALAQEGDAAVHFLTGPAGCGKTSLVSALACEPETVIDLRFHVFRPMQPGDRQLSLDWAGRTARASALWGDLLAQLRQRFFQGRLARFRVPVRNDFLKGDPERLRAEVLRLAQEVAKERHRPVVIAIDGLDHAVRARILSPESLDGEPSVLDVLVPPDRCPPEVVFLLAGQPNENYPAWLRQETGGVRRWSIPALDEHDVLNIVSDRLSGQDEERRRAISRVILDATKGNTLATVFAVEEAVGVPEPMALRQHLKNRQLGSDLDSYYETIWNGAFRTLHVPPSAGVRLAAALVLSSARLTGAMLAGFFHRVTNLGSADWGHVLRALQPLLVQQAEGWQVRHNDVRVFLHRFSELPERQEAAREMARYHVEHPGTAERHQDLFRLLELAGDDQLMWQTFDPSWVVEAVQLDRLPEEIYEDAARVLKAIQRSVDTVPWASVHQFALGLTSAMQFERTLAEEGESGTPASTGSAASPPVAQPFLPAEASPAPVEEWTCERIGEVLADVEHLVVAREAERAQGVLARWFGDRSPEELAGILGNTESHRKLDEGELSDLLKRWGELTRALAVPPPSLDPSDDEDTQLARAAFWGGWLLAGARNPLRSWSETIGPVTAWFREDFIEAMKTLEENDRLEEVLLTLDELQAEKHEIPYELAVLAASWAVEHGTPHLAARWLERVQGQRFAAIPATRKWEREAEPYDAVAFVLGWVEPHLSARSIVEEGSRAYIQKNRNSSRATVLARVLFAAATAGQVLRLSSRCEGPSTSAALAPHVLQELLEIVLALRGPGEMWPGAASELLPRRLSLILHAVRSADARTQGVVTKALLKYELDRPVGDLTVLVLRELEHRRCDERLRQWLEYYLGEDGVLWREPPAARRGVLMGFQTALGDPRWRARIEEAWGRHRLARIGYASHKDYSLEEPLAWFLAAARDDSRVWESYGPRLLRASDVASSTGDNRVAGSIDNAVASAAARCGPGALWRLAHIARDGHGESAAPITTLLSGAESLAGSCALDHGDAAAIWCLAAGVEDPDRRLGRRLLGRMIEPLHLEERHEAELLRLMTLTRAERQAGRWEGDGNDDARSTAEETTQEDADPRELLQNLERRFHEPGAGEGGWSWLWSGIRSVCRGISREHPGKMQGITERLLGLALQAMGPYPWFFDGCRDAMEALVPLLDGPQRRRVLRRVLERVDPVQNKSVWHEVASSDLRGLCLFVAGTLEERKRGLDRALSCHEAWWQRLPGLPAPPVPGSEASGDISSWPELGARALVETLETPCAARAQRAIRGLWLLTTVGAEVPGELLARWDGLSPRAKERALLLAERVAAEREIDRDPWAQIVELGGRDPSATVRLQAWATADSFERDGVVVEAPRIQPRLDTERPTRLVTTRGILTGTEDTRGLFTFATESSVLAGLIKRLAAASGNPSRAIEQAYIAFESRHAASTGQEHHRGEDCWVEDVVIPTFSRAGQFVVWAWTEAERGTFGDDPLPALAQALLRGDDPWLLTETPILAADAPEWPVDDELERLIGSGGRTTIEQRMLRHIRSGLQPDDTVIGAVLLTFSRKHDVRLELDTVWGNNAHVGVRVSPTSTFNGRTTWWYREAPFEPAFDRASGSFLARAGGLAWWRMWPQVPRAFWRDILNWKPSSEDPRIWLGDGKPVARLEHFRGPFRDMVQDHLLRQPTLFRWVCSTEALQRASASLGVIFRTRSQFDARDAGK